MALPESIAARRLAAVLAVVTTVALAVLIAEWTLRSLFKPTRFLETIENQFWIETNRLMLHKPASSDSNVVYDAFLGWRTKPDFQSTTANHDQYGFRIPAQPRPLSQHKILFVGDSFTYGLAVRDDETFAYLTDKALSGGAINAAANAYGFDQTYLRWQELRKDLNVDVVIAGYMVDDFFRNTLKIRDLPKPYFTNVDGSFVLQGQPVPTREAFFEQNKAFTAEKWQLEFLLDRALGKISGVDRVRNDATRIRLSRHILELFNASVEAEGAELIMLIIGHCDPTLAFYREVEEIIVAQVKALGIRHINFGREMRAMDDYAAMYAHCHYSPEGHRYVAERILEELRR